MSPLKKPIGLLGGTFDPIHMGHLRMAVELFDELQLSRVHLIPCYQPVHRNAPFASAIHRFKMVELAIQHEVSLYADAREIKRAKPSYTIDTLLEIKQELPNTPLCLLIGSDAFLSFMSWHRWQEILTLSHLIIANRGDYQLPKEGAIADLLKSKLQNDIAYLHENLAGGILLRPITMLQISASEIRKQFAIGKNPRYLLPNSVYQYIAQQNIYRK